MKFAELRSRLALWGVLAVTPCLLWLGLRKIAHERPHYVRTEELDVKGIFFSGDEKSVCTASEYPQPPYSPLYNCCALEWIARVT